MCGICGVAYADADRIPDENTLLSMNKTLRSRGPDGEGVHRSPGIGLGHRRLGIIDLQGGNQPMSDPDTLATVCFNGEIYNFKSLRRDLEAEGVVFRTLSDTEVLLQGYLNWGLDSLLPRLHGMFVFAIWDHRYKKLLLCRDRLGVKPLYWTLLPDALVFGSTLDAVLANPLVPRPLNHDQFRRFLAIGYIPSSDSAIGGIQRLAPGHVLTWEREREPQIKCWWNLAEIWMNRTADERNLGDIEDEFSHLLRNATEDRLISDVPLGAFLSGGLDSSTIVSLMKEKLQSFETFSVGFKEPSYNELPWARQVGTHIGSQHFDEVVEAKDPELLIEIAQHLDEPFADTSVVPTYLLCQMARKRVTVALSGDGGDELLAGYITHVATALQNRIQGLPKSWISLIERGASYLPESREKVNWAFKAKQFTKGLRFEPWKAHASWRMFAHQERLAQILKNPADPDRACPFLPFRQAYDEVPTLSFLDRFLYVDYRTWLVDDILVKVDRASMAHGLEVRSPFLDHRLIEFCAALPPRLKMRGRKGKILLRQAVKNLVPKVALRRSKSGFNAPVSTWLAGSWNELFQNTLRKSNSFFNTEPMVKLLEEHRSGQRDHGQFLFTSLMGMLWLQRVKPTL